MKNMQTLNRELKMAELERIKMEAETVKLQKEANWFPWLSLAVALIALIVALVK